MISTVYKNSLIYRIWTLTRNMEEIFIYCVPQSILKLVVHIAAIIELDFLNSCRNKVRINETAGNG